MELPYQFSDIDEIILKKNKRGSFNYKIKGTYKNTHIELFAENVNIVQSPIDNQPIEEIKTSDKIYFATKNIGLIFCPY